MPFQKGRKKTGGKKHGNKHRKTIEQEMALEFIRQEIRKNLPALIGDKIEIAKGIWVEQLVELPTKKGKPKKFKAKVYRKLPDPRAIEELLNRVVGRPKMSFEMEGQIPTSVVINITSEEVNQAKARIKAKEKI